jgi:subtilisin family serine protease
MLHNITFALRPLAVLLGVALTFSAVSTAEETLPDRYLVTFESPQLDLESDAKEHPQGTASVLSVRDKRYRSSSQDLVTRISETGGQVQANLGLAQTLVVSGYASESKLDDVLKKAGANGYHIRKDRVARLNPISNPLPIAVSSSTIRNHGLDIINAREAWKYSRGRDVVVAVIDSGVSDTSELKGRILYAEGKSFVSDGPVDTDPLGHGTHVACTVAGITCGVAPGSVILPIKAINSTGHGYESDALSAVNYAMCHGADIINLSLGWSPTGSNHDAWSVMLRRAEQHGIVVVAATGNNSGPNDNTHRMLVRAPAVYPSVIAVGATDHRDNIAGFSLYRGTNGSRTDICAPGVNITSYACGGFRAMSGTSMAAPHVSGTAALLREISGPTKLCPSEMKQILTETATRQHSGPQYGSGVVNALAAIRNARSMREASDKHDRASKPGKAETPRKKENSKQQPRLVKKDSGQPDMDAVEKRLQQHLAALRVIRSDIQTVDKHRKTNQVFDRRSRNTSSLFHVASF